MCTSEGTLTYQTGICPPLVRRWIGELCSRRTSNLFCTEASTPCLERFHCCLASPETKD